MENKLVNNISCIGKTYEEYLDDMSLIMISNGVKTTNVWNALSYWHGKGYIEYYWREGLSSLESYSELKDIPYYK